MQRKDFHDIDVKIEIQPKPDNISWEQITELLHLAFSCHVQTGLKYSACDQTAYYTQKRVGNGICFIVMLNDVLVGTATLHIQGKKSHLSQVATHPDYRCYRIGIKLQNYIDSYLREMNVQALFCDTAIKARKVVSWYLQTGWQKVGLRSYRTTNYYSVVLRKNICGRKYMVAETWIRLVFSSIICYIVFRRNGAIRLFVKPFYNILYILYKRYKK